MLLISFYYFIKETLRVYEMNIQVRSVYTYNVPFLIQTQNFSIISISKEINQKIFIKK